MEEITSNIAAEVMGILYNTDTSLVSKIPYRIWEFLDNEAMEYEEREKIISQTLTNKENLSDEAKAIITLIYKDYFCESEEERKEINSMIIEGKKELENEEKEKYNPFKNVVLDEKEVAYKSLEFIEETEISDTEEKENQLVVSQKWYIRLIEKMKSFFK